MLTNWKLKRLISTISTLINVWVYIIQYPLHIVSNGCHLYYTSYGRKDDTFKELELGLSPEFLILHEFHSLQNYMHIDLVSDLFLSSRTKQSHLFRLHRVILYDKCIYILDFLCILSMDQVF